MRIRWHGQSAFTLSGQGGAVLIDPFDMRLRPAGSSFKFDYPQIPPQTVDLVLITHEHFDHNGLGVAAGGPAVIRSIAGRIDSPVGEVVAVAGEHDAEAGTRRGPNTLFAFQLDGINVCHLGDLGQDALRPAQAAALGTVDLLFVPVGGGPTIDDEAAATVVAGLDPRWVVPMHYATPALDFVAPADGFLDRFGSVTRFPGSEFALEDAPAQGRGHVLVPAPPLAGG
jgi:L-ascorbate metabolism protein UlaG (beta-lactamase superfamily)